MRNISVTSLLALCLVASSFGQQEAVSPKNSLGIVFYNVENLFDIVNDTVKNDDEFLPGSRKQWNTEKYQRKISDLAGVISAVNEKELPAIIGLAEVENRKVLDDLAGASKLRKGNYGIVHFEGDDERGIDVALLYSTDEVTVTESRAIKVSFGKDIQDFTRDILYAKCAIKGDRNLHLFINHWPSRTPDRESSEMKRVMAALALRKAIDNILNFENDAAIIVMGDFNDEPTDRSIFQVLNASDKKRNAHYRDLYNLMYESHNNLGEGTVAWNDSWQMFDQIIVSQSLFAMGKGYYLTFSDGKISRNDKVLVKDPASGKQVLNRTYSGDKYNGGVSDHLPVYAILRREAR